MGVVEELANELARDAIAAANRLGDTGLIDQVAKTLGATSASIQEAYLTAVRVHLAADRARKFIEDKLAQASAGPDVRSGIDIPTQRIMNAADDGVSGH